MVFVVVLFGMNLFPLLQNKEINYENDLEYMYKSNFVKDDNLSTPNVYWILCDGMLGFDAMEKYFNDSQEKLTNHLTDLGFSINKGAMIETGHSTSIAVPTLMCRVIMTNI